MIVIDGESSGCTRSFLANGAPATLVFVDHLILRCADAVDGTNTPGMGTSLTLSLHLAVVRGAACRPWATVGGWPIRTHPGSNAIDALPFTGLHESQQQNLAGHVVICGEPLEQQ